MTTLFYFSKSMTRGVSVVIVLAWISVMAVLVNRSYVQATGNMATDLARYGSSAQWRGIYYRGEKIGFTVSQTVPIETGEGRDEAGFELQEDGQLQMALLGAHTFTTLQTRAIRDIMDQGLHEFLEDFVSRNNKLGAEISDGYRFYA